MQEKQEETGSTDMESPHAPLRPKEDHVEKLISIPGYVLSFSTSLSALHRSSAAPHASPNTSLPVFPTTPPNPSCRTKHAVPSSSSAMVMVVGRRGVSKEDGSGRRVLLSMSAWCSSIYDQGP